MKKIFILVFITLSSTTKSSDQPSQNNKAWTFSLDDLPIPKTQEQAQSPIAQQPRTEDLTQKAALSQAARPKRRVRKKKSSCSCCSNCSQTAEDITETAHEASKSKSKSKNDSCDSCSCSCSGGGCSDS